MKREFGVEANVGKPQSGLPRNHPQEVTDVDGKFVRQSGGKGQYGHVVLTVEPMEPGGKGLSSATKSRAVVLANTSLRLKRASSTRCQTACWLAPWWTSACA